MFRDPAELQVHVMIKPKQQHWRLQLSSAPVQRLLERLEPAAQSLKLIDEVNLETLYMADNILQQSIH